MIELILVFICFALAILSGCLWFRGRRASSETTRLLTFPDKCLPCASVYKQLAQGQEIPCTKGVKCQHAHLDSDSSLIEILQLVYRAEREILLCMYSFTFDKLAEALIAKKKQGVLIKVITDPSREGHENDQIPLLKQNKIPVRERALNKKDKYTPKMHNKFLIVDNLAVIHGSANWTVAGFLHNSEAVTLSREGQLIKQFREFFESQWSEL